MSFAPGDTIVAEGNPADRFYVVAHGEVEISRRSSRGRRRGQARDARAGAVLGEVGILAETQDSDGTRVGDVELLAFSWETSQGTLERSDPGERDFSEIVRERVASGAMSRGLGTPSKPSPARLPRNRNRHPGRPIRQHPSRKFGVDRTGGTMVSCLMTGSTCSMDVPSAGCWWRGCPCAKASQRATCPDSSAGRAPPW